MAKAPVVLDRPIAWVTEAVEVDGKTQLRVTREGMTREEIIEAFPPHWTPAGQALGYNRKELVKAVIYEAFCEAQEGAVRERKNVRGFSWYERLKHTLLTVMGESQTPDNQNNIDSTISQAWDELVSDGWVTYHELNVYSEKEAGYHISVVEDSPYPTHIVMVEKASLFDALHDLADTYEISLCCLGGQSSKAAAMAYARRLESIGIDLTQTFTVYSYADFNPHGWEIPEAFIRHLSVKIPGDIRLVRLGILREQLGESVLRRAELYSLDANTKQGRKTKQTMWEKFVNETGGLYTEDRQPAQVEMDIYSPSQIRDRIIDGLSKHIESFPFQIRPLKKAITDRYDSAWKELSKSLRHRVDEVYKPYFDAIYDEHDHLEVLRSQRAMGERAEIARLRREIAKLEDIISAKTADLKAKEQALDVLCNRLGQMSHQEYRELESELQWWDIPGPDNLIKYVEENGGWENWADELGIEKLKNGAVAQAAREHRLFDWRPSYRDTQKIQEWIEGRLDDAAPHLEADGPSLGVVELVTEALNEVD